MSLFKGVGTAIVTPFNEDNSINWVLLEELIEYQIGSGIDAIIFCGTTGESPTLSEEEHKEVIRFGIEKVAGRCQVVAGTGSNNTAEAITYSKQAEADGADALLLITPYYNKPTQRGLLAHFTAIADAVNIPIILYNVPSRTAVNIEPDTMVELAKHPMIQAVKEASGDLTQVAEISANTPDDFLVYSGNDDQVIPVMSVGGVGVISVTANFAPRTVKQVVDFFNDGDVKAATELTLDTRALHQIMFIETNPAPVKVALELAGFEVGPCRLPLVPVSDENIEKIRAIMSQLGMLI